jgi:predicted permease
MNSIWRDVSYGARTLRKSPGFTVTVILTLAFGIGGATAVFSFVNAVLLRPFPYTNPQRLVLLWASKSENVARGISGPDLMDVQAQATWFDGIVPIYGSPAIPFTLGGGADASTANGLSVGTDLFSVLGTQPYLGRTFVTADSRERVTILSYGLWQERFGGDSRTIGKTISLNDQVCTVIGVMPRGFFFPDPSIRLWTPLEDRPGLHQRGNALVHAIARLRPGTTLVQAQSQLDLITNRLAIAYPDTDEKLTIGVFPLLQEVVGRYSLAFWSLLCGVGLLLLIACANTAHLLLARGLRRRSELCVRVALGATRWMIFRQLLTESLLLGLAGGTAGIFFAVFGIKLMIRLGLSDIPRFTEAKLDGITLLFALGASLVTSLLFGLLPAISASRLDLVDSLKLGGAALSQTGRSQIRDVLVVSEVSIAFLLLVGAGLLINSFVRLMRVDWGFHADHVLVVSLKLPKSFALNPALEQDFVQEVDGRLKRMPAVNSVGISASVPTGNLYLTKGEYVTAEGHTKVLTRQWVVGPDYFRTLNIPVIQGREFTAKDGRQEAKVIVIAKNLADEFWPGRTAIGKTMTLLEMKNGLAEKEHGLSRTQARVMDAQIESDPNSWDNTSYEVIGVVSEVKMSGLKRDVDFSRPSIYVDYRQRWNGLSMQYLTFFLQTRNDPMIIASLARDTILQNRDDIILLETTTMPDLVNRAIGGRGSNRLLLVILTTASGIGLILVSLGLYGLLSYMTVARSYEIGVRVALGAQRGDIFRMILGRGLLLTAAGLLFGVAGAIMTTDILSSYLYGVLPTDLATICAVLLLLLVVAFTACYFPARRAAKLNAWSAIRCE